tara:strand:- start:415 stop:885 length:471 start_codon:yes stop_codon:yes gene_type:complete
MTWFKVLKRGTKIKVEYVEEVLYNIMNRDGYVILGKHTIEDFYDEYKNLLREKQQQAVTSAEKREFSNEIGHLTRGFRYNPSRFVVVTNNIASRIFRMKITSKTPNEGDLKGVKSEIVRRGSIYFKNMDVRNKYVEQAREIVSKKRYSSRRREALR